MLKSVHSLKHQRQLHSSVIKLFSSQQQSSQSLSEKELKDLHSVQHTKFIIDPKFYENDIEPTSIKEIDFIRSPFYDVGKAFTMNEEEAEQFLANIDIKASIHKQEGMTERGAPSKEEIAYTRYADNLATEERAKELFTHPRGTPYRRINNAELFRVQKPSNHIETLKRQKSFLADKFYPPFDLKEFNLLDLFGKHKDNIKNWQNKEKLEDPSFTEFQEKLLEIIPRLNHDILIQLALHLAYDAKINDAKIWRYIEDAAISSLHYMTITQICQLEWAIQELKPKKTSARLGTMLMNQILNKVEKADREELMCILQGFRKRQKRDLYVRIRTNLVKNKSTLFPDKEPEKNQNLVNMLFCLASNKPSNFGVYQQYYKEELDELISLYEEDLKDAIMELDEEHLTRMAQALYLFKTDQFENLWLRIEKRTLELKDKLDHYQVCNIIRSFSRSQYNHMSANDKTYYQLEEKVIKTLNQQDPRDLTHLMYSYSVRGVGNPELYKLFDQKLDEIVDHLDYPSLFNAIYYMLFRSIDNRQLWERVIQTTLNNKDILPIIYYRPFKISKHFLKAKYPDLDIQDYIGKFWYAERYFTVLKIEEQAMEDFKYMEFKKFLTTKCHVYPYTFMNFHNVFLLHYAFVEQKIAINFHLNKFLPDRRVEPTEMQKLNGKMMAFDGWEVLELTERMFDDWEREQKVLNVKGWIKEAKERQVKKGIIPATPKVYV